MTSFPLQFSSFGLPTFHLLFFLFVWMSAFLSTCLYSVASSTPTSLQAALTSKTSSSIFFFFSPQYNFTLHHPIFLWLQLQLRKIAHGPPYSQPSLPLCPHFLHPCSRASPRLPCFFLYNWKSCSLISGFLLYSGHISG